LVVCRRSRFLLKEDNELLPASCNNNKGHARLCGRTVCPWRDRRSWSAAILPLLIGAGIASSFGAGCIRVWLRRQRLDRVWVATVESHFIA
jgi:hypothetical protein